jgi:glycosidase
MIAMMKYWIKEIDIDGFRCIGAELVPTDFWNVARKEIDKIKPVLMISESALPEHHLTAFDVTYSWDIYSMLTSIIDMNTPVTAMNDSLYAEASQFPKGSLHLRFITPCEENRDDTPAVEKFTPQGMKAATVLMFTIPGVPSIYNGEEAGYCGRLDLFNKVDIDWSKGLEERQFYERLSALRCDHPALRRGSYTLIQNTENIRLYSFFRTSGSDSVLVVINFSKEKKEANLHMPVGSSMTWKDLFSGIRFQTEDEHISVTIVPWGSLVLVPVTEREIR